MCLVPGSECGGVADIRLTLSGSGVDMHACVYARGYCASCECVSISAFVCL